MIVRRLALNSQPSSTSLTNRISFRRSRDDQRNRQRKEEAKNTRNPPNPLLCYRAEITVQADEMAGTEDDADSLSLGVRVGGGHVYHVLPGSFVKDLAR